MDTIDQTIPSRTLANAVRIATLGLLGAGIAGFEPAVDAALAVSAVNAAVYLYCDRTPERMAIQIRLVYLVLLVLGSVPPLGFLLELLFVGSATVFMTGYCPLTRVLSLMPWNRQLPLSRSLIVATFVSRHPRSSVEARQAWAARPGIAG